MTASLEFLAPWLTHLSPGGPVAAGPLTLIPLLGPERLPPISTLRPQRANDEVQVREVSESGVVGRVLVVNRSPLPLLLLDGEELVGAKQNRVVNASTLVGPGVALEVPVSCCERGRWRDVGSGFRSVGRSMPLSMKAAKHARVSQSLRQRRGFDADQGAVWRDVDGYLRGRGVRSRTDALSEAFDTDFEALDRLRQQLMNRGPGDGEIGVAFALQGRLLGIELFGSHNLYAQAYERLLHACFAEALGVEVRGVEATLEPLRLVHSVLSSTPSSQPSPGLGEDHRFACALGTGFLLSWDGAPIHAAVFAPSPRWSGPTGRGRGFERGGAGAGR